MFRSNPCSLPCHPCGYIFEYSKVYAHTPGWGEEGASPLPLFPAPILLGPGLVHLLQLREPVCCPGPASPPCQTGAGRLDKLPPSLSLGYCLQREPHSSLLPGFWLSLKQAPGRAQVGEDWKGPDLGVSFSHCRHSNQGPFISRKQLHPAAPTSPDGGSLPLPSLPLLPPFPS